MPAPATRDIHYCTWLGHLGWHDPNRNDASGTAHLFAFSLIIEGTTEKMLKFIMPFKSIYNKNFDFIVQNMYFWTLRRVSSKKNFINWHHFCHERNICWPFKSCPPIWYVSTTQRCGVPLPRQVRKTLLLHDFTGIIMYKPRLCKWPIKAGIHLSCKWVLSVILLVTLSVNQDLTVQHAGCLTYKLPYHLSKTNAMSLSIMTLTITTLSITTQYNDSQHNNTQHNDTQHNDTPHDYIQYDNKLNETLS